MRPYLELVRHFANRFFQGDLVSPQGERSLTLANILGLLATPGILWSLFKLGKYIYLGKHLGGYLSPIYHPASLSDKYILITVSMVLVGFVTVIQWDTLFPDACDYMILTALPLKGAVIFAAKSSTVVLLLVFLSLVVNTGHTLIYPIVAMADAGSLFDAPGYVLCHATALFGGSAFVFLSLVALQGALMSLLPSRAFQWISRYAQFLVMLWLVFLFLMIPSGVYLMKSRYAYLFPPMWFLGLYETLLGQPQAVLVPLAGMAWKGLGAAAILAPLTYAISYARHLKQSLEAADQPARGPGWIGRAFTFLANRLIVRDPLERATFYFLPQTILRNGRHRLYFSAYAGVGCAFVLEGLVALVFGISRDGIEGASVALLSIPLVLSFFTLSGLRVIFAMPAYLEANWVFQLAENGERRKLLWGVRKAVLVFAVLPLFAALFPWHVSLLGWEKAVLHLWYDVILSWMLLEALLVNFRKIPFTCSYPHGRSQTIVWWILYWFFFSIYAYSMALREERMLESPIRLVIFCFVLSAVLGAWIVYQNKQDYAFIYEDHPEPAVRVLDLKYYCDLKRPTIASSSAESSAKTLYS